MDRTNTERLKLALYAYLRQSGTWVSPDHARALWGEIYPPFEDADRTDLFPLYIVQCRLLNITPKPGSQPMRLFGCTGIILDPISHPDPHPRAG
jgi:hypothetical protein